MAQYVFVKFRDPAASGSVVSQLEDICESLTPRAIRGGCESLVADWMGAPGAYYAIQNSDGVDAPQTGALVIGWINPSADEYESHPLGVETDGSYAIIKADPDSVSFFTDQFGSRTLWYYLDDQVLIVSTSQRAIVRFKGSFVPNQAAIAWFLSSGCQGPFISWDEEVHQVRPEIEYILNVGTWQLERREKDGMVSLPSGNQSFNDYVNRFELQVSKTLRQLAVSRPVGKVLLPISGGWDSRLLLALSKKSGTDGDIQLVNWGVEQSDGVFDDKMAASRVAAFYGKTLLDRFLPQKVEDYGHVLDQFVEASEGRIDHFNAYTDGFAMWSDFHRLGYRTILRGDIPFPTARYIDEATAREQLGLSIFSDFSNMEENADFFGKVQLVPNLSRSSEESLLEWRDRLYATYRIPLVVSAFSDLVSGYVENFSPMMSWALFRDYTALPDSAKGNKEHIKTIVRNHDHSGVPSNAVGSLRSPASFFANESGRQFLASYLAGLRGSDRFPAAIVETVAIAAADAVSRSGPAEPPAFLVRSRAWLSARLPSGLKGYLKSRRVRRLEAPVLAYRLVLADKTLQMYSADAESGQEASEWGQYNAAKVTGKSV